MTGVGSVLEFTLGVIDRENGGTGFKINPIAVNVYVIQRRPRRWRDMASS